MLEHLRSYAGFKILKTFVSKLLLCASFPSVLTSFYGANCDLK